ncbi:MAG: acyl-CoA dehydrogenase family protein, partial [Mycobacterium sp.]
MRFSFTEDQLSFQTGVRDLLDKECGPEQVRAVWSEGWSRERWRKLAEVGAVGLTVPEQSGGMGMDLLDLVLVLEESGRAALPEPLAETTAVAVPALTARATGPRSGQTRQAEWLARIADGTA